MNIQYELPCYGIICNADAEAGDGSIQSDLKDVVHVGWDAYVDAIESLILALACEGVDISQPEFITAIETAVQAGADQFD